MIATDHFLNFILIYSALQVREFTIINLRISLFDISIQQKSRWSAKACFCKKKQAFSLRWTIESVFE